MSLSLLQTFLFLGYADCVETKIVPKLKPDYSTKIYTVNDNIMYQSVYNSHTYEPMTNNEDNFKQRAVGYLFYIES